MILLAVTLGLTWETSFRRVAVPDSKGRQTKAILTLSDDHKTSEVHPAKGPYRQRRGVLGNADQRQSSIAQDSFTHKTQESARPCKDARR